MQRLRPEIPRRCCSVVGRRNTQMCAKEYAAGMKGFAEGRKKHKERIHVNIANLKQLAFDIAQVWELPMEKVGEICRT